MKDHMTKSPVGNTLLPVSVSIISYNEEDNIGRCIEAIHDFVAEIVVVDSLSTDRTVEIARSLGATVYVEPWKGHIEQKNSALAKCSQPWVLSLDCDEVVSKELRQSIADAVAGADNDGFWINRRTHFMGEWINHAWYPDWNLRLVKREKAVWKGVNPHDRLTVAGSQGRLQGDLYHYSFRDSLDMFTRTVKYAAISAESYQRQGGRIPFRKIVLNPLHAFFRHYVVKRGFLDGRRGFILSVSNFISTFMKYVILYENGIRSKREK